MIIPRNDTEKVMRFFEVMSYDEMDNLFGMASTLLESSLEYKRKTMGKFTINIPQFKGILRKYYNYCHDPLSPLDDPKLRELQLELFRNFKPLYRALMSIASSEYGDRFSEPRKDKMQKEIPILEDVFYKSYKALADSGTAFIKSKPMSEKIINNSDNYLIAKDNEGDYLYKNKRMEFGEAIYKDVFDILYTNGDQDGFISYDNLEKALGKRGYEKIHDSDKSKKRIKNALTNG